MEWPCGVGSLTARRRRAGTLWLESQSDSRGYFLCCGVDCGAGEGAVEGVGDSADSGGGVAADDVGDFFDGVGGEAGGVFAFELGTEVDEVGALAFGSGGVVEEFEGFGGDRFCAAPVGDELGDDAATGDDVWKAEEFGGEDGAGGEEEEGVGLGVERDHRLELLGDLERDGAALHEGDGAPADDGVGVLDDDLDVDGEATGAAGEETVELILHDGVADGDDADGLGVLFLEKPEGVEEEIDVAEEFVGAGAGHHGDAGLAFAEGFGAAVEGFEVQGFVEEHVADELGGDVALLEEALFEGEEAEDHVGHAAELVDAPAAPGPDLGGDEVDDFDAAGFGEFADGEVGGGGVDGDMGGDGVFVEPVGDAGVDSLVFADFGETGHAHDGVVAGAFDDGGAGAFHFGAAPGEDIEGGVSAAEFGDDTCGVVVTAGLEGREEQASG